jgi:hypothetical protein
MAYSIQYARQIKRKRKRSFRAFLSITALICALLLRILAAEHIDALQAFLLGQADTVAAFCEDFVNHDGSH